MKGTSGTIIGIIIITIIIAIIIKKLKDKHNEELIKQNEIEKAKEELKERHNKK